MKDIIFNELSQSYQRLLNEAALARKNAYAPYSNYAVGAAIITKTGEIFTGANMENASYGLTSCAEVGAIQSAISNGYTSFNTIAIVVGNNEKLGSPCGRCRQIIYEISELSQTDIKIIISDAELKLIKISSISELLPEPFGPQDLIK